MKVTIDLQEGFENDEVLIYENQNEIYHAENVRTRNEIGLARSFELEISGQEPLKIVIPSRGISERKEIDVADGGYIGISINEHNKLEWRSSDTPTMFM